LCSRVARAPLLAMDDRFAPTAAVVRKLRLFKIHIFRQFFFVRPQLGQNWLLS
jgi:hypothetical protein